MNVSVRVFRRELPKELGSFTIDAHGFKPLTLRMEEGIPVIYEIGVTSSEDSKPWPHHFLWIQTGEPLPDGVNHDAFVGTVNWTNVIVVHLFQEWNIR